MEGYNHGYRDWWNKWKKEKNCTNQKRIFVGYYIVVSMAWRNIKKDKDRTISFCKYYDWFSAEYLYKVEKT